MIPERRKYVVKFMFVLFRCLLDVSEKFLGYVCGTAGMREVAVSRHAALRLIETMKMGSPAVDDEADFVPSFAYRRVARLRLAVFAHQSSRSGAVCLTP